MVAVTSQIDANSEAFAANRASMMTFVERLRSLEARAVEASAKRRATFEKRGQLLPADRLHRLLDPGMPFLRLHTLANFAVDNADREASIPGASVMVGIGFVGACDAWFGSMTPVLQPVPQQPRPVRCISPCKRFVSARSCL